MDNPLHLLRYTPRAGDILLSLLGAHSIVHKVEGNYLYFEESKSVGRPIPQIRLDLVSGKFFLIRKTQDEA